jgi:hypothetical protein
MSHTTLRLLRSASTFSTPLLRHKSTVAQIASTLKDVGSVITKPIARMQHQNVSSASKEVSAPLTATDRKVAQLTQQQKLAACSDADILNMIDSGKLRMFALEQDLGDMERAVRIRRSIIGKASALHVVFFLLLLCPPSFLFVCACVSCPCFLSSPC